MRNAISRLLAMALLSGATGLFVLGHPAEVRAEDLLCPPGRPLINGQCGDGAFSGDGVCQPITSPGQGLFGAGGKAGVRVAW